MPNPQPEPSMGDAALELVDAGFAVLPLYEVVFSGPGAPSGCACGNPKCDPRSWGKHPRIKGGAHAASRSRDEVAGFWRRWPSANVGIALAEGELVLDIDPRSGGDESLAAREAEHGALPWTWLTHTGSGGRHFFFQLPAGTVARNRSGLGGFAGLDSRAAGGYIVAPPSTHASGGTYAWIVRPGEFPLAPCPDWLLALVTDPPTDETRAAVPPVPTPTGPPMPPPRVSVEERARRYVATMPEAISGAGGHAAAWQVAVVLVRGFDLSPDTALAIFRDDYNPRCRPPWSDREMTHKIEDAAKHARVERGWLLRNDHTRWTQAHSSHIGPEPPPPTDDDAPPDGFDGQPSPPLRVVNGGRAPPPGDTSARPRQRQEGPSRGGRRGEAWEARLRRNDRDVLQASAGNAQSILENDRATHGVLAFDRFSGKIMVLCDPPWTDCGDGRFPREIADHDIPSLVQWYERHWGIEPTKDKANDAAKKIAHLNAYDPLLDYLNGLVWDQIPRLDTWLDDYLGVKRTALTSAIGRKWLISAVKRAFLPGTQADYAIVIEGEQGLKKSTALRVLAGDAWFTDNIESIRNKREAAISLVGKWIVELAEGDALTGVNYRSAKSFFSTRVDRFRSPYDKHAGDWPRRCVLAITMNEWHYLTDPSGNRRYWPVRATEVNLDGLRNRRDQLWAEAVVAFRKGESSYLDDTIMTTEMRIELAEALEERMAPDLWEEVLGVKLVTGSGEMRSSVTLQECMKELDLPIAQARGGDASRLGAVLRRLGYVCTRSHSADGRRRVWVRGTK